MKKQLVINGDHIHDIPSFYKEINRVFMQEEDWEIGNSLDAFDDLLYGGLGAIKGQEPVQLIWLHISKSKDALGYEATRNYYLEKLAPGSPFNKTHFTAQLSALEAGKGQTYFDIVLEIIAGHKNIALIKSSSK
ncbi:barstar family protein [Chitinophaga agri]|uniref:Ribonuclease inhibitor n=1 Tax=Chitinophaga agri TaxID=2703787 RepID=A0A6B9ZNT5_9BACT|nr:barstar family protein [Chitinophaga agri]QHS63549.1 ribonuclease inhibitor [Chitinophaga agri]